MERKSCEGCKQYLGGGCCRINMELECGKGEFELYESEEDDLWFPATWKELWPLLIIVMVSAAMYGIAMYKLYHWIF